MKSLIFALLLCSTAQAEEFKFTYIFDGNRLQYKTDAPDWETAFGRAAEFCFKFFIKKEKVFREEKGLDIIDTCANPNSRPI